MTRLQQYPAAPPSLADASPPVDYVAILWRRRRLVGGFLLISLALGGVYWLFAPRTYVVTARLLVQRQGVLTDMASEPTTPSSFLATQAEIIRSPAVIEPALRSVKPPVPIDPGSDPLLQILQDLTVRPLSGTNVVSITYGGHEEDFAIRFAQALIASYREYLKVMQQDSQSESLQMMRDYERDLRHDLERLGRQYTDLLKARPSQAQAGDAAEVRRTELTQLSATLLATRVRRLELENSLETSDRLAAAERAALPGGTVVQASASLGSQLSRVAEGLLAEIADLQQRLTQLHSLQKATERLALPNDRRLREIREAITSSRKLLEEKQQEAMNYELAARRGQQQQQAETRRQELAALRNQEQQLTQLYREAQERGQAFNDHQVLEQRALASMQQVQDLHNSAAARLTQLQVMDQSVGKGRLAVAVRVLEVPVSAVAKMVPPPLLLLLLCLFIGLTAATGVASLLERRGTIVLSAKQVQDQLALPVFAGIPAIKAPPAKDASLFRSRQVCQAPQCVAADAFRTLRTRLMCSVPADRGLVVQLASAIAGEGKTTIAANLACSFAQLGKHVVLVDADLRLGTDHWIFNVDDQRGLSSVLQNKASLEACITQSPLAPVDVLPAGPEVDNPTELLAQPRFDEVLTRLRNAYDVVLLDGPPILMDAGGLVLSANADELLLCLRVGHSSLQEAFRACESLEGLNKRPLGIVLSQVPFERQYLYRYGARPGEYGRIRGGRTVGKSLIPLEPKN